MADSLPSPRSSHHSSSKRQNHAYNTTTETLLTPEKSTTEQRTNMPRKKQKPLIDETFRPASRKSGTDTGTAHQILPKKNLSAGRSSARQQSSNRTLLSPQQPATLNPSLRTAASLPFSRKGREPPRGIPLRSPLDDWSPADLAVLKNLGDTGLEWEIVALEMQAQTPMQMRSAEECRERYAKMHMWVLERTRWEDSYEGEEGDGGEGSEVDGGWDSEGDGVGEGVGGDWGDDAIEPTSSPCQVLGQLHRAPPLLPTVPTLRSQRPLPPPLRLIAYPPQSLTFIAIPTATSPPSFSPSTSNFTLYSSVPNAFPVLFPTSTQLPFLPPQTQQLSPRSDTRISTLRLASEEALPRSGSQMYFA